MIPPTQPLESPKTGSLEIPVSGGAVPPHGWLQAARVAKGLSQREAAARAGVSQQAFNQYEAGEVRGTITLERLQRAAEALDCELVYFLRATSQPATRRASRSTAEFPGADLPVNLL